jgi:AcrR family transcriptional regulator
MERTLLPKQVDHSQRRRDFVNAAHDTLLRNGLAGTTLRNVAKRAGFTTGALVHYFKDKDDLIRKVLEENGNFVRERMEAIHCDKTGRAALRALALEALPTDRRSVMGFRIWLALWYHSEESRAMRSEERRRYKEWLGRIRLALEQSVEQGELDRRTDVDEEARLFVAMVDGLGIQSLMSKEHLPRNAAFVDRYLDRLYGT